MLKLGFMVSGDLVKVLDNNGNWSKAQQCLSKQGSTVPGARIHCSTGKLATVFYDARLKPDLIGMIGASTIAGLE